MAKFNLEDYIEVKDRIVLFWEKYPEGAIHTKLLFVDDRVVRMQATVYATREDGDEGQLPLATGHAEEYRITEADIKKDARKKYEPNATSAVENCETSAIGRALAAAGFGVSKSVASRQEMEKVARQQIKRENDQESVDKRAEAGKVDTNGSAEGKVEADEARKIAGRIKGTGIEMSAVEMKLVGMGVAKEGTLSGTIRTMTKTQAEELEAWVLGEREDE